MSEEIPDLSPAGQKSVDAMIAACQPLVPDGESVHLAWTAKKGLGSHPAMMATWFTQVLIVFQQFRVRGVQRRARVVSLSSQPTGTSARASRAARRRPRRRPGP